MPFEQKQLVAFAGAVALCVLCADQQTVTAGTRPGMSDTQKKILYFEGEPRPEAKFIMRAMNPDTHVRVVTLQRTTDGGYLRFNVDGPDDLRDGFPTSRDVLFAYQGLILGSVEASAFTPEQHRMLADFVTVRGGGLLALGGPRAFGDGGWAATPLAQVLPIVMEAPTAQQASITADRLIVRPTAEGLTHPAAGIADGEQTAARLWSKLPTLTTVNAVSARPGATTLLTGADDSGHERVVLAFQRQGRGKSVALTVQDSWLWVMQPKTPNAAHETFWQHLVRWLVDDVPDVTA